MSDEAEEMSAFDLADRERGAVLARRRRRWSEAMKRRIVTETHAPGTLVSVVARRYDVNASQVHTWRRRYAAAARVSDAQLMLPVMQPAAPMAAMAATIAMAAARPGHAAVSAGGSRRDGGPVLRGGPAPGQELVDALGRMGSEPGEDVDEPSGRIDAVELGGLGQGVDGGGALAAVVRRDLMMPGVWGVR